MTDFDDHSEEVTRRTRRRRQKVAGAAGLAAVLGVGAYFVTSEVTAKDEIAPEPAAIAPANPTMSATAEAPEVSTSASAAPTASTVAPSASAAPSTTPSRSIADRIKTARSANAKLGTEVRRPLQQPMGVTAVAPEDIKVRNSGSLKDDGETLRLVTAKGDMTGQRELAWVADEGKAVGDVLCSQTFHFSEAMPPTKKPTLMICWKVSADKSVYAVGVNLDGHPSAEHYAGVVDKEWKVLH